MVEYEYDYEDTDYPTFNNRLMKATYKDMILPGQGVEKAWDYYYYNGYGNVTRIVHKSDEGASQSMMSGGGGEELPESGGELESAGELEGEGGGESMAGFGGGGGTCPTVHRDAVRLR